MGGGLGEGEADTNDLRRADKGVRFVAGVEGRPGGNGDSETERGSDDKVELKWFRAGGDEGGLG